MPIENFRMVCFVNPILDIDDPPQVRIHLLDLDADVSYVAVMADSLSSGLAKLRALTGFINQFLEADPESSLGLSRKGVSVWPRR